MSRSAIRRNRILAAAIGFALISPVFTPASGQAATRTWTNSTGNNLWADPLNWANGLPSSFDTVQFPAGAVGVVNLGGVNRQTSAMSVSAAGYTFQNGTLVTNEVFGTSPTIIAANLETTVNLANVTMTGSIVGDGAVTLTAATLAGVNTYFGATVATDAGTFSGAGSSINTSQVFITSSTGRLTLAYDDASGNVNRLRDGAPVAIAMGGRLAASNAGAGSVTENVGVLTSLVGATFVDVHRATASSGAVAINAASADRQRGSTLNLSLDADGGTALRFTAAPAQIGANGAAGTTTRSVVPWVLASSIDRTTGAATPSLATYDATDGLRPLNVATEYAPTISAGAPTANVRLTSSQTLASPASANGLVIHDATLNLNAGANLSLTSGALLLSSNAPAGSTVNAISGAGSSITPGELVAHTVGTHANTRFVVAAPISAASITKSGPSTLVLTKTNAITGSINLNDGEVESAAAGALGNGAGTVTLAGGRLNVTGASQSFGALATVNPVQQQLLVPDFNSVAGGRGAAQTVTVANGIAATFNGPLSGAASLVKAGAGSLVLAAADNPFGGGRIFVDGGTLQVDGDLHTAPVLQGGGSITPGLNVDLVGPGATLAGNGIVRAQVFSGNVAPGVNGPGRLTMNTLFAGAPNPGMLTLDLDGTIAASQYDQLVILNTAALADRSLSIDLGFAPSIGQQFLIVDKQSAGAVSSTFTGLPEGSVFGAGSAFFQISYTGGTGNDVVLTTVVPEPSLSAALTLTLASLSRRTRRREARM